MSASTPLRRNIGKMEIGRHVSGTGGVRGTVGGLSGTVEDWFSCLTGAGCSGDSGALDSTASGGTLAVTDCAIAAAIGEPTGRASATARDGATGSARGTTTLGGLLA